MFWCHAGRRSFCRTAYYQFCLLCCPLRNRVCRSVGRTHLVILHFVQRKSINRCDVNAWCRKYSLTGVLLSEEYQGLIHNGVAFPSFLLQSSPDWSWGTLSPGSVGEPQDQDLDSFLNITFTVPKPNSYTAGLVKQFPGYK